MPSFHSPDENPDNSPSQGSVRFPNRLNEFVEPPAIKKLCDTILQYAGTEIFQDLQLAREQGALTAERFTSLIRAKTDSFSQLLVARSLLDMLSEGVDSHFADCMSSVVHVAHGLLTDRDVSSTYPKQVAHRLVGALVAMIGEDADFHAAVVDGLDEHDFSTLLRTVNDGDQFDKGYWSCLELQTICAPTIANLQRMFDAHELVRDALGEHDHPSQALGRAVGSLAQRDYRKVFDLVVREFRRCEGKEIKQGYDFDMLEYAVAGLAMVSAESIDQLLPLFFSTDPHEFEIATKIAINLGRNVTPKPSEDVFGRIRLVLFEALDTESIPSTEEARDRQILVLRAFAAVADPDKDLQLIQGCANKLLAQEPSINLIDLFGEIAETYAQGLHVSPLGPVPPVPARMFERDYDPDNSGRCAEAWNPVLLEGQDPNAQIAEAAIMLSGLKRKSEVLALGSQIEQLTLVERLEPRPADEGSVFIKLSEARAFTRRFEHLVASGYCRAAAALLPEAVSILKCSEERDIRSAKKVEGTYADLGASLMELSVLLARDEVARSIAVSRLSQPDWNLLRTLHKSGDFDHGRSSQLVALSCISLRAVLENDDSWHQDFFESASSSGQHAHHYGAPAYLSEQLLSGSSWTLLEKLNLRKHEEMLAWSIASGLRLTLPDGYNKLFELVSSPKGEDVAKGLLVAQALRHEISDEQREELLHLVRVYLDEPGELGLDALATFSCFAGEHDSALEVLSFRIPAGIEANRFRATQNLAIARVLENHLLGHDQVRDDEISEPWSPDDDD